MRVLIYRLVRLRRLWTISVALGVAVVLLLMEPGGALFEGALICSVFLPILHVLFYPGAPQETLAIPIALVLPIIFAATFAEIGWPPARATGVLQIAIPVLIGLLALLVFMVAAPLLGLFNVYGPRWAWAADARAKSRAGRDALMRELALGPNRVVGRVICGRADDDGIFSVRSRFSVDKPLKDANREEEGAFSWAEDGTLDVLFTARVMDETPSHQELEAWMGPERIRNTSSIRVTDLGKWREVHWAETLEQMTIGQRVGFWLEDYLGDALTEAIDRAERRAPRANRCFRRRQLVVDLIRAVFPWMRGEAGQGAIPPH